MAPSFDSMVLLRVAPLITSSFTLWFSWDQFLFLNTFLHRRVLPKTNDFLPTYFDVWFPPGVAIILSFYPITIGLGIANAVTRHTETPHFYTAGVCLAAFHFFFVPFIKPSIDAIRQDRNKGASAGDMRRWLNVHIARSLLADFPSWLLFLLAALNAVQAV